MVSRQSPPKEIATKVRVRAWVGFKGTFRVGGQLSLGVTVLKSQLIHQYRSTLKAILLPKNETSVTYVNLKVTGDISIYG